MTAARVASIALAALLALAPAVPAGDAPPAWQTAVESLGLPLTIVRANTTERALLVFISGDGGWAEVDKTVSGRLAEHGITTIGWSSLRYFATTQPTERVAADLRRVVDALAPAKLPIWVGGYSFGAEVVPVVVAAHWPRAERERVAGMLLLAPSASATFRIDPRDWVREPAPDPRYRVEDAVRRLEPARILCVTGADDATTSCAAIAGVAGVAVARVPGDHHFENGIPQLIAAAVAHVFARPREGS